MNFQSVFLVVVDVHIQVAPKLSVSEGHYISDKVHNTLLECVDEVSRKGGLKTYSNACVAEVPELAVQGGIRRSPFVSDSASRAEAEDRALTSLPVVDVPTAHQNGSFCLTWTRDSAARPTRRMASTKVAVRMSILYCVAVCRTSWYARLIFLFSS